MHKKVYVVQSSSLKESHISKFMYRLRTATTDRMELDRTFILPQVYLALLHTFMLVSVSAAVWDKNVMIGYDSDLGCNAKRVE